MTCRDSSEDDEEDEEDGDVGNDGFFVRDGEPEEGSGAEDGEGGTAAGASAAKKKNKRRRAEPKVHELDEEDLDLLEENTVRCCALPRLFGMPHPPAVARSPGICASGIRIHTPGPVVQGQKIERRSLKRLKKRDVAETGDRRDDLQRTIFGDTDELNDGETLCMLQQGCLTNERTQGFVQRQPAVLRDFLSVQHQLNWLATDCYPWRPDTVVGMRIS